MKEVRRDWNDLPSAEVNALPVGGDAVPMTKVESGRSDAVAHAFTERMLGQGTAKEIPRRRAGPARVRLEPSRDLHA